MLLCPLPRVAPCHNRQMCGRYRLSWWKQIIAEHSDMTPFDDEWEPHSAS